MERRRRMVSGSPISLLRLPLVARTFSAPNSARRIAAVISLTVVFPLLPTIPATGSENRRRQNFASAPSALIVSATQSTVSAAALRMAAANSAERSVATIAATAPRANACDTKSWPSNLSPLIATNRSPGASERESIETPLNHAYGPSSVPSIARAAVAESIIDHSTRRVRALRGPNREMAAARPRFPGRARGPFRQAGQRRRHVRDLSPRRLQQHDRVALRSGGFRFRECHERSRWQ